MLDESDQRAVIRGMRNGHRDAWSALYDGYSADVWRYVARLVGQSAVDVADIVQDTFIAAARSAQTFDDSRGTIWGWLTGIAHHQTSLYWRQINKRERLRELAESRAGELAKWIDASDSDNDHEVWHHREVADLVRATLASLSPDYAAALTGKYLDERTLEQMAQDLGGSVEAIKSKLARARREFRTKFERLARDPATMVNESHWE